MSCFGVHMDAIEFGNYIKLIRDNVLSRPAMAKKSGLHVNTIKGYEMEGRLADIDYLAALAVETGHCFSDLVNKRLLAGKFGQIAEEQHLMVSDISADYKVSKKSSTVTIPVFGSKQKMFLDTKMLPTGIEQDNLALFDARHQTDFQPQILVFNTADKAVQDGQLFVIDIGNGAIVRRLQNGLGGSLLLATDSPGMAPLAVSREQIDNITIVGRVVCVLSYT